MNIPGQEQQVDFTVNKQNLFREESITDLNVASIRKLVPVLQDGSDDKSRTPVYIGHTQLLSPHGPLPIQARLTANSLEEALDQFPQAMRKALAEMMEQVRKMQEQQEREKDSRIIVPGRNP